MNTTSKKSNYWFITLVSFFTVLFVMPLGHALMITMEHLMDRTTMHYSAFAMGAVGLFMVIRGVFTKGDTRQTLWGLFGGLLFWTGWVEFLFMYYAHRYGVQPEIVNGEVVTKPEYLILPATFGLWAMIMTLYLFSARTGCNFINWWQKRFFRNKRDIIVAKPMTRHVSIITFMELIMILWTSYLLLMFCYDPLLLGDHHPVTFLVGLGCFIGSIFMFIKQLKIGAWGANIRFAIATVIVFWTPVEILGRVNFFSEIWTDPMEHTTEMIILLIAFTFLVVYLWYIAAKKKKVNRNTINEREKK
ncbi:hypothetical protein [Proteiniphilum sp. UBA5384]|uniref:hypothetical protein n=1 Tax=Proteiniphilum sp. UBA5384 TaxID=1947279 RepID=UPI0025DC0130|nr:hypothetical protein [Proteiniphilum sp. UBA5384]